MTQEQERTKDAALWDTRVNTNRGRSFTVDLYLLCPVAEEAPDPSVQGPIDAILVVI